MTLPIDRRTFLGASAASLVLSATSYGRVYGANDRVRVGIMGMGGRGNEHIGFLAKCENVDVVYLAEPDKERLAKSGANGEKKLGKPSKLVADFRTLLDDKGTDALIVSAPNHWHAPATLLGLSAGKHVYVEKPCSHTVREGEMLVESAEKHKKLVQMGNQRRSYPALIEAMAFLHGGGIGRVYLAQCWYHNSRPTTGKGEVKDPPANLDYELWQGPVTRKPFRTNTLHYTWHWFWQWGNGEVGNNGVHMIDVCRWGLQAEKPIKVTSTGGRYRYQDDQETPDTNHVAIDYPDRKSIVWEGLSCNRMPETKSPDIVFHGENGSLAVFGGGYKVYDPKGKEIKKGDGPGDATMHVKNFLDSIRGVAKLNSPITEGHLSTMPCHLANISYRTSEPVHMSIQTGHPNSDSQKAMCTKEYAKGWEPKV